MLNRDPKEFNDFLQILLVQTHLEESFYLSEMIKFWKEMFGDNFSENCQPTKLKEKTLTIRVKSSVWRTEIKLRKEQIITKINQFFEKDLVIDIKFR